MANEFKIRKGLIVEGASGGTVVDVQGSQGQLFSVTDNLSGSIFAVSDISGVPILDVNSSGLMTLDGPFTQTGGEPTILSGTLNVSGVSTLANVGYLGDGLGSVQYTFQSANNGFATIDFGDVADSNIGRLSYSHVDNSFLIRTNNATALTLDASQTATFAGNLVANGSIQTLAANADLTISGDTSGNIYYNNSVGTHRFRAGGSSVNSMEIGSTLITLNEPVTATSTVTATTFLGDLNGTINTVTTAVTKPNTTDDNTVATTAFVKNLIAELPAGLIYKGTWDADTNTPTLAAGGGEISEGTTTTVTADKLIDSAATFTTDGVAIGDRARVENVNGVSYALVTSVDSETQLTLNADIVVSTTESYIIETPAFLEEGNYYIVSVDGATDLNGITDWKVGDWVVASSTNEWQKIDNSSVLDGQGTGQTVSLWAGSGDSNTLSNSILTQTSQSIITQTAGTGEVAQYYLNSIADRDSAISFQQATVQKSKIGYDHSEDALAFVHGNGAFSTAGMVLDGTGVGIGVTDPGYAPSTLPTANVLLQLGGDNLGDIPELRLAGGNGLDVSSKIVFDNDILGRGMSIFMTSDTTPFGPDGLCFFNENSVVDNEEARVIMKINRDTQKVGIGINNPTSKLHINQNVTDPDLDLPSSFAVQIDSNHSGSAAATGDREQGGLYIDVDSSTTGGDISNEHRLYGVYSDVRHSGDSDRAVGVYSIAEQNTTTGDTTWVIGGEFVGVTDGGSSAALNSITGVSGSVSIQDATPLINSYGGYFRNASAANRTGATTSTYGLYAEVELNSDSAYTNIYGQRITLDVNTSGFTASNMYLLDFSVTGLDSIPVATNTYAIHQPNDIKSYHKGDFGIGISSPGAKLDVANGNSGGDAALDFPVIRLTNTTASSDWDVGDKVGVIEYFTTDTSGNAPYVTSFINSVNETGNGTLPSGALVFGTANYNASSGANEKIRLSEEGSLVFRNFVTSLATPTTGYLKEMFIANVDGVGTFASNGASNGAYGSFKFITRKGDSSDPIVTMTLDNSHQVGIGTQTPNSKLQVAGGIQMADDTDNAGAAKVGTMRYRTGTEYVEVTGTELITNGDFEDGGANWNGSQTSPATVTFSNGKMTIVSPNGESAYRQQSILTPTKTYRATVDVVVRSGTCKLQWGTGTGAQTSVISATGSYVFYKTIPATGADALFYCARNGACDVDFDNVSVMEVTAEDASYADMCMQTGSSTYEWVNILRNTY